jgi:predicted transcriptional regulator
MAASMSEQSASATELMRLTAAIVSAHVGNNPVPPEALPRLIEVVHQALRDLGGAKTSSTRATPAVPVSRSVFPDHLVCLEDGKQVVMLKRHLQTAHGMTPEQYRERWNLPPHYPMVAPDYAERRSELAIKTGLGRKPPADGMEDADSGKPRPKPGRSPTRRGGHNRAGERSAAELAE